MDNKLNLPFLDTPDPERFIKNAAKFSDLMMMYRCTIRELQTKLEVLNDEFSIENKRNPISFIKTRVKKPESIYRKLQKLGYEFSAENRQRTVALYVRTQRRRSAGLDHYLGGPAPGCGQHVHQTADSASGHQLFVHGAAGHRRVPHVFPQPAEAAGRERPLSGEGMVAHQAPRRRK